MFKKINKLNFKVKLGLALSLVPFLILCTYYLLGMSLSSLLNIDKTILIYMIVSLVTSFLLGWLIGYVIEKFMLIRFIRNLDFKLRIALAFTLTEILIIILFILIFTLFKAIPGIFYFIYVIAISPLIIIYELLFRTLFQCYTSLPYYIDFIIIPELSFDCVAGHLIPFIISIVFWFITGGIIAYLIEKFKRGRR